jgi:hypothetical protein
VPLPQVAGAPFFLRKAPLPLASRASNGWAGIRDMAASIPECSVSAPARACASPINMLAVNLDPNVACACPFRGSQFGLVFNRRNVQHVLM